MSQVVHEAGQDKEALHRARARNPIGRWAFPMAFGRAVAGSQGYLTKAVEHIPVLSDVMVWKHRYWEELSEKDEIREDLD